MIRAVLLPLFFVACCAWSQDTMTSVSVEQLDASVADVTANLAPDDPKRANLLRLYGDTRAALVAARQFNESRESFAQARAGAADRASAIEAGLSEREVVTDPAGASSDASLADIEQAMQVRKAELDARRSRLAEINDAVAAMPERAAQIRARLTELGSALPKMQSKLALMPRTAEPGSATEASLWLAEAQIASAMAEKASLDEELLSQPMRLQLLAAQQDLNAHDIRNIERHLQSLDRRAAVLREGEASQAQSAAKEVVASAQGKHKLVQQLADENAALSGSFSKRSSDIDEARRQELAVEEQADRLEGELKGIEHKLIVLGLTTKVGQILREQEAQLPSKQEFKKRIAALRGMITDTSVHQLSLVDERRQLASASDYVDQLLVGLDEETANLVRDDLLALVQTRRDLLKQALDLENTYLAALGSFELDLRRYSNAAKAYRKFTEERLLWIPSRAPFTLLREQGVVSQLDEVLEAQRWKTVLRQLPYQLVLQPQFAFGLLLLLVLVYCGPSINARLVATGREVGYVRTDLYANTLKALGYTLLQSAKWPLLLWSVGQLFEQLEQEPELATALHSAFSRTAMYFWGLEFLRTLFIPKGLVDAHFRWPASRTAEMHHRFARLEQTIVPAILLVVFTLSLFPLEVGGALGALGVVFILLSMAYFFRRMPRFMQGKLSMALSNDPASEYSFLGRLLRLLLVLVPVAAATAVLFGYIYTAMEFALLLLKTLGVASLLLLLHEMGLRWLRMTRRRMLVKAKSEAAQAPAAEGEPEQEDELLENDSELLNDDGTKLLNMLTLFGALTGIIMVWSEVLPALGILDSVQLWHQTTVVDGQEVVVPVTLGRVIFALIISVLGWIFLARIPGLLEILLRQKMGVRPASAYAATRVFQYAGTGILVAAVLGSLGGSWSQI
ncbi:hypothetical protein ACFL3Y_01510, partial [Pseudomonadota bacterium]